jgi:hypothetical protein
VADLITQADIENRYSQKRLKDLLDDDGDGVADAALVTMIIQQASARGKDLLKPGWPSEPQIELLVSNDISLKAAVVDIAMGYAGRRRAEFLDAEGMNPYIKMQKVGEAVLREYAKANDRSIGEPLAGNNARVGTRVNADREAAPLIFTPTKANPRGPGGF